MKRVIQYLIILIVLTGMGCNRQSTEPDPPPTQGTLQGTVISDTLGLYPATISWEGDVLAHTDTTGYYRIDALNAGNYLLTASSPTYLDTTIEVTIIGGQVHTLNFNLRPDMAARQGALLGTIVSGGSGLYPAYIIWGDSLLAMTDVDGSFGIEYMDAGSYQLIASAVNFADTTFEVSIEGMNTSTVSLELKSDDTMGWLLGEFQDDSLFQAELLENPDLAGWTAKEICDAATGATIQFKTMRPFVPFSYVYLGDDSLTMADQWGQYGFLIQCGTYPFTGTCNDYQSTTGIATVRPEGHPEGRTYLNFFLKREE